MMTLIALRVLLPLPRSMYLLVANFHPYLALTLTVLMLIPSHNLSNRVKKVRRRFQLASKKSQLRLPSVRSSWPYQVVK